MNLMRYSAILLLLLNSVAASDWIRRADIKPSDFQPLISAPWKVDGLPPKDVIRQIYLEPTLGIRAAVLGEYMRTAPEADLAAIFDQAVALEGHEVPDATVAMLLRVWAARAPEAAWKRTQDLFKVVGIEHNSLNYAGWDYGRITVTDHAALQQSAFRLKQDTLCAFPEGVDRSELAPDKRVQMFKAFNERWFTYFQTWPGSGCEPPDAWSYTFERALSGNLDSPRNGTPWLGSGPDAEPVFELIVRRWLVARPKEARDIIRVIQQTEFPPDNYWRLPRRPAQISNAFLLLWARADQDGLQRWSDEACADHPDECWRAKCILMAFVDPATTRRWLGNMMEAEMAESMLSTLSKWQPELAMQIALQSSDASLIGAVLDAAGYGPWDQMCFNTCHYGLSYARDFDMKRIPKGQHSAALAGGCTTLMEQWGDVDCGECARFGMSILPLIHEPERDEIVKTLRGEINSADNDGVWDRTFCALRVWAVMRPKEMRQWVATQSAADMREALTWLLDHPWGREFSQK